MLRQHKGEISHKAARLKRRAAIAPATVISQHIAARLFPGKLCDYCRLSSTGTASNQHQPLATLMVVPVRDCFEQPFSPAEQRRPLLKQRPESVGKRPGARNSARPGDSFTAEHLFESRREMRQPLRISK